MTKVAGYELVARVDEGGMGEVFRATQGGRVRAVKILRQELVGQAAEALRFVREAQSTAALEHPAIVRVVEAGVAEDGRPFIAYEWLEGPTLAAVGSCSTARAAEYALAMLDALATAHEMGFVHRDLKPANVIVVDGYPKLIDFGLVASLARSVDGQTWTRLTQTGFVVGTPPYMAPEQIEGEHIGVGVDLWAMGVILYWLVSGREPFAAKTSTLRMLKTVSEPERSLVAIAPHVHGSFAEVVHRALDKDPGRRWPSAHAMAAALGRARVSDDLPRSGDAGQRETLTAAKRRR